MSHKNISTSAATGSTTLKTHQEQPKSSRKFIVKMHESPSDEEDEQPTKVIPESSTKRQQSMKETAVKPRQSATTMTKTEEAQVVGQAAVAAPVSTVNNDLISTKFISHFLFSFV